jgi:hypothetical protein
MDAVPMHGITPVGIVALFGLAVAPAAAKPTEDVLARFPVKTGDAWSGVRQALVVAGLWSESASVSEGTVSVGGPEHQIDGDDAASTRRQTLASCEGQCGVGECDVGIERDDGVRSSRGVGPGAARPRMEDRWTADSTVTLRWPDSDEEPRPWD